LRQIKQKHPETDIGIYPGYGVLTVVMRHKEQRVLSAVRQELIGAFPSYVFDSKLGKIEEALSELIREEGSTLSFAESCTGGLLAHKITLLPGASDFFLGSIVSDSNHLLKKDIARLSLTLSTQGAVSAETVKEMLKGLFEITQSDDGRIAPYRALPAPPEDQRTSR
jgi:nicotinamide-nucleotide amidase